MTEYVATLITRPEHGLELMRAADTANRVVRGSRIVSLSEHEALDIYFTSEEPAVLLRDRIAGRISGKPVDIIVQPMAHRRKALLLADMDSTIIGQECIDELADFAGFKAQVSDITERAMRGEIAFEPALRERVALLAGLPESTVDRVISERITINSGARALISTMRKNGAYTLLVSGGFTSFTSRIAARVGFNEHRANILLAEDGKLTGKVADPILGKEAKLASLEEMMDRWKIEAEATVAVGDGANDLAMIGRAGLGVAYRAKPKVAEAAAARIDHTDLHALLFAQGYRRDEFVD